VGHAAHYGVMQARGVIFFVLSITMSFHVLVVASGRDFLFKPSTMRTLSIHAVVLFMALVVGAACLWTPWLNSAILGFAAPHGNSVILLVVFLFSVCIFDESVKMLFYRPRFDKRRMKRRKIAQLSGIGLMNPWASKKSVAKTSMETIRMRGNFCARSAMSNANLGMTPTIYDNESSDDPNQVV